MEYIGRGTLSNVIDVTCNVRRTWYDIKSINTACLPYPRSMYLGRAYKDGSLTMKKSVANRRLTSEQLMTWFCVVPPNLDPTLGVALGVEGVYPSMWEVKVGSGPR